MSFDLKRARHLFPGGNAGGPAVQTRGQMGCFVVERKEALQAAWAARGGDFTATQICNGVKGWGQGFAADRQRCATCEHEFQSAVEPEAFFLAIPYQGDGDSLVIGVCKRCVDRIGSDGLLGTCAEVMKRIWPAGTITGDVTGASRP